MLRFVSVVSLVACLFTVSANAEELQTTSAAPTQAYLRINPSGELEVLARRPVFVVEQKQRTVVDNETRQLPGVQTTSVTRDGKTFAETDLVTSPREVTFVRTETYDEATLRNEQFLERYPASANGFYRKVDKAELSFYDLSGIRLSMKAVEDRLHGWTLVLISKTGKPLDRRFANLFKPTTIVVGIPTPGSMPIPAPSSETPEVASASTTSRQTRPSSTAPAVRANETRPTLPTSPEPTFAFAKLLGETTIVLRTEDEKIHHVTCTIPRPEGEQRDGQATDDRIGLPHQVQRTIETRETVKFPTAQVSVTKVPNEEVTTAELPSVLSAETLAAMSADGRPVDPFWLRNLQEGALVIVAPAVPPSTLPPGFAFPRLAAARPVEVPRSTTPQAVPPIQ